MAFALIDTNVYIGHWERGLYADALASLRRAYIVRQSSVVLSELRRGARTARAAELVVHLRKSMATEWAPLAEDWWETGRLVLEVGDENDWEAGKRREFQNDALIALTARRHGAAVMTANVRDFELLARRVGVRILEAG